MIEKIWQKYDDDGNGELDFYETKNYVKDILGGAIDDNVFSQIFREFDKDGSGCIGKDEMGEFMKIISGDTDESPTKEQDLKRYIQELEEDEKNQ